MGTKNYIKKKRYNLLQQKIALIKNYPSSKCDCGKDKLIWYGKIQPTAFSKTYTVALKYTILQKPEVWIIGDELEQLDNPNFPHKYKIDKDSNMVKICLYRYLYEFSSEKLIADTIIPWTVEWLYFYEIWLTTGEWLGGGEHPVLEESKNDIAQKERGESL